MGRLFRILGVSILGVLAIPVVVPAQDVSGDLTLLRKALRGKGSAEEILPAIEAATGVDSREAADLLLRAAEGALERLRGLSDERVKLRAAMAALQGDEGTKPMPWYPDEKLRELESMRARETALRAGDAGERRILKQARTRLARLREPAALAFLGAALRSRRPSDARRVVTDALCVIATPEAAGHLVAAASDRDATVREAVMIALGRILRQRPEVRPALAAAVDDPAWPVRLAALRGLALVPDADTVDRVAARMAKESGRTIADLVDLMAGMTGQRFGGDVDGWRHWWTEHRADFAEGREVLRGGPFPPAPDAVAGAGAAGEVRYHGITTWSRRILFVLDISGTMDEPGGRDPSKPRLDEAKAELLRTLRTLGPDASFDIHVFHDSVHKWKPTLVAATEKAREDAKAWVEALGPSNWTNTFGALEEAFRISAAGGLDADYGGGADTIFLLTDGSPTTPEGKLTYADGTPETDHVLEAVRDWNAAGRVTLHCIGVGSSIDERFLRRLAAENNGRCVLVK